jgi:hypothetical protein
VQGVDRTVDLHTTGWAPYPLRWTLRITEPMTDAGFALAAHGDLGGSGRWAFARTTRRSGSPTTGGSWPPSRCCAG